MREFNPPKVIFSRLVFVIYAISSLAWVPGLIISLSGSTNAILFAILDLLVFFILRYIGYKYLDFVDHFKSLDRLHLSDEEIAELDEEEKKKLDWERLKEKHRQARED
jgi:amino acid permease